MTTTTDPRTDPTWLASLPASALYELRAMTIETPGDAAAAALVTIQEEVDRRRLVDLLQRDAHARCMWEDDHHLTYLALGYDVEDAWTLVAFDWSQLTGEPFETL